MDRPKTILLVDDIPEYLETMVALLPTGSRALKALDENSARRILTTEKPDLVVIDVRLREDEPHNLDGLSVLRWVRRYYPEIPVVMISAYLEFEYQAECLNQGAQYFLTKPIRPDEFVKVVHRLLNMD